MTANYKTPDRILAGLSARQLLVLGIAGIATWLLFLTLVRRMPPVAAGLICAPILAAGALGAARAADGTPMDRFALMALRYLVSAKDVVRAPRGLSAASRRLMGRVREFEIPVVEVTDDGLVDAADFGTSAVVRSSAVNFQLRSEQEKGALTDGYARLLNSLEGPTQFLVSSRPVDAEMLITGVEESAAFLPHPALTESALDFCRFFGSLLASEDVLRHEVFVCIRDPKKGPTVGTALGRRAESLIARLRDIGIRAYRADAEECRSIVSAAANPQRARKAIRVDGGAQ